jgi:hypothetical protein
MSTQTPLTDKTRIETLDRMLTDESGFAFTVRWDNTQDVVTITDALGNVWGEAMADDDEDTEDTAGRTIRAAIDSIGSMPLRTRQ